MSRWETHKPAGTEVGERLCFLHANTSLFHPDMFAAVPLRGGTLGSGRAPVPGAGLHRLGGVHQRLPRLLPGRAGSSHPVLRLRLPPGACSDLAGPGLHGAHLPPVLPSGADPGPGPQEGHQHLWDQRKGHGDDPHERQ